METVTLPIAVIDVQIFPIKPKNGHIAFGSGVIKVADRFKYSIGNIAIYTRPHGGYRLVFPTMHLPTGKAISSFCPLNQESAEVLERAILGHLENLLSKTCNQNVNTTQTQHGGSYVNTPIQSPDSR